MEKTVWLSLSQQEKVAMMHSLLTEIIDTDKQERKYSKGECDRPDPTKKFKLEDQVLHMIKLEAEDNEEA